MVVHPRFFESIPQFYQTALWYTGQVKQIDPETGEEQITYNTATPIFVIWDIAANTQITLRTAGTQEERSIGVLTTKALVNQDKLVKDGVVFLVETVLFNQLTNLYFATLSQVL